MAIRLTESQARLMFGQRPPGEKPGRSPRAKKRREDLPENQVTAQCIDWLRLQGWICTRRQSGLFSRPSDPRSRIRIGEPGEADWYCRRPMLKHLPTRENAPCAGIIQAFALELKAPGREPTREQLEWGRRQMALGFVWTWTDDLRKLQAWHERTWGNSR